jgi:ubiquinone biosynthesis protein UbiJ
MSVLENSVTTDTTTHADVDIKLKSSVFLQLMQGEDLTELLRQDKIIIHWLKYRTKY